MSKSESEHSASAPNDPAWLKRIKKGGTYAVVLAVGGIIVWIGVMFDAIGKVSDRLKAPDAFVLAEDNAKSSFSDQFAQRAWRRIFWARNFRARVLAQAPIADIDLSWKNYIDADAEWNANLMISIVGLQNYYGRKRSEELEFAIQDMFRDFDEDLAQLRRSEVLRKLRKGEEPSLDQVSDLEKGLGKTIEDKLDALKNRLYVLVRCVSEKDKTKNLCADDPEKSSFDFWGRLFGHS